MKCQLMRVALLALFVGVSSLLAEARANPIARFETVLGAFRVELFPNTAPVTVENFLNYVNDGDYNGTFVHRSVRDFVIQGGGYEYLGNPIPPFPPHIPTDPPIANEFSLSNLRGTIAMAKTTNPDSATSEWFINLADNTHLDNPALAGGFTVFGRVLGDGMQVVDAIAAVPVYNFGGAFSSIPLRNFVTGSVTDDHLVLVDRIVSVPEPAAIWLASTACLPWWWKRSRWRRSVRD